MSATDPSPGTSCLGLFNRKVRWGLTLRGWAAAFLAISALGLILFFGVASFLAISDPVPADVLVVEGWMNKYGIRKSADEFDRGQYRRVLTTGGPVVGNGGYVNDFQTSASVGADRLIKAGVPKEKVQMVPSRVLDRDRTYQSAVALRNWIRTNDPAITSINLVTEGFHARRTRYLFKKALGPDIAVGIISVPYADFDLKCWWRCSEGVQEVFGETLAYVYARLFFHPPAESTRLSLRSADFQIPAAKRLVSCVLPP